MRILLALLLVATLALATSAQATVVFYEDYTTPAPGGEVDLTTKGWTANANLQKASDVKAILDGSPADTGGEGYAPYAWTDYQKDLDSPIPALAAGDYIEVTERYGYYAGITAGTHTGLKGVFLNNLTGGAGLGWQFDYTAGSTAEEYIGYFDIGGAFVETITLDIGHPWAMKMRITGTGGGNGTIDFWLDTGNANGGGTGWQPLGSQQSGALPAGGWTHLQSTAHDWGGGEQWWDDTTVEYVPVPEPATLALLVIGAALVLLRRRRG